MNDIEWMLMLARVEAIETALISVAPQVHGKETATFLEEHIAASMDSSLRRFEDSNPAMAAKLSDYLDGMRNKKPPG